MNEITPLKLKKALDQKEEWQLLDIRELHEHRHSNIGGDHIPMALIPLNLDKISKEKKLVMYCRSGGRSANIIQWLEINFGYTNLYNLKGGLLAWRQEVDSSLEVF